MKEDRQTAFVSGGTSGIGLAAAERFARMGYDVLAYSVDSSDTRGAAQAQIEAARRSEDQIVEALSLDVTNADAVGRVLGDASDRLGAPGILFNSAGLGGALPFEEIDLQRFDRTMQVNVYGIRHVIAACLERMTRGAHIVNVASMSGLIGSFGYTMYSASKFAVVGFSEALRAELKPRGISVSVACPVQVDTPMLAETNRYKPAETLALNRKVGVISADETVDDILLGMKRRDFLIIPGTKGRLVHLFHRVAPRLRERLAARIIEKAQR